MIVPMKKLTLLVMNKDKSGALEKIRELGVLHLSKKNVTSPVITKLLARCAVIENATGILDSFTPKKGVPAEPLIFDGDLASHIISLSERRRTVQDFVFAHNREMNRFEKWGDFDPKDFAYLSEHGVNAFLYELPLDTYKNIAGNVPYVVVASDRKNNVIRFVTFEKIPNRYPYPLPEIALSSVRETHEVQLAEIKRIDEELASLTQLRKDLDADKNSVFEEIEFETARAGMEDVDEKSSIPEPSGGAADLSISLISGYVPAPDMGAIKRAASENNWALCADDPANDDEEVPTKLKNSRFVSLIYPVMGFLEMTPGYRERDISGWFLLFFTLFFGMIFGDAAYGVILLLISFFAIGKTMKKGVPVFLKFLLLLSISNIAWGLLVCSWFGLDTAVVPRFLQNISLPLVVKISTAPGWLASYNAGNFWIQSGLVAANNNAETVGKAIETNMMLFCFSIAVVQLGIAHITNAVNYIRSPKALGEIGRLGLLFGMYFVTLSLVVFNTGFAGIKPWQLYLLACGFVLVFVFGSYEDSILKSVVSSCSNFITVVLNITNTFSDIMSYIRLWAVGLAAASIAGIINDFASPMLSRAVFFAFGLLLFGFGHGFNMVLNVLAVLVHGIRLNTLEFSSHVGLAWSGFAYKPFAKR